MSTIQADSVEQQPEISVPTEETVASDTAFVEANIGNKISELEERNPPLSLRLLIRRVRLLIAMLRDPTFHLSLSAKLLISGALIYFILPTDLTPDFIPFVGYVDDTAVIAAVLRQLAGEIDDYIVYLKHRF